MDQTAVWDQLERDKRRKPRHLSNRKYGNRNRPTLDVYSPSETSRQEQETLQK